MAGYKSASFDPDEAAAASDLASAASDAASNALSQAAVISNAASAASIKAAAASSKIAAQSAAWEAVGGGGATKDITQATHGFAVGDVIKFAAGVYAKAKADSSANAEVVGIVSAIDAPDDFTLLQVGYIEGLSGLTANSVHYLSDATAGALTATEPTTEGSISKPCLIAVSTSAGYFFNFRGAEITDPTTSRYTAFTNATLDAGILTITHNFGHKYVGVVVYDNNDKEIIPDEKTVSTNSVAIDLTSFGTISGTWRAFVWDAGSTSSQGNTFDHIEEATAGHGVVVDSLPIKDAGFALGSDADGDIYYRASGVLARLAKGAANLKMFMNAGATAPEWAAGIKVITTTYDSATKTGALAITGVGFKPSWCVVLATIAGVTEAIGVTDGTTTMAIYNNNSQTGQPWYLNTGAGQTYSSFTSWDADGATWSITKASSPTGTVNLAFLFGR